MCHAPCFTRLRRTCAGKLASKARATCPAGYPGVRQGLRMSSRVLTLLLAMSFALTACMSVHGPGKLPVANAPLQLRDAVSGNKVDKCLIIPRYTSSRGMATGAGHGPGAMSHSVFIAHPFIYVAGDAF